MREWVSGCAWCLVPDAWTHLLVPSTIRSLVEINLVDFFLVKVNLEFGRNLMWQEFFLGLCFCSNVTSW